jgi:hypothetical protein
MGKAQEPHSMVDLLPELSGALEQLLTCAGEQALANQISKLRVLTRCRCSDDFCGTFYTQPKPFGQYGPGLRTLALEPDTGHLILDVVDGHVASVQSALSR